MLVKNCCASPHGYSQSGKILTWFFRCSGLFAAAREFTTHGIVMQFHKQLVGEGKQLADYPQSVTVGRLV